MNYKRILAGILAATMIFGSSMAVLAAEEDPKKAEGEGTGTGSVEGVIDTDVFSVVVPTSVETTLAFIVDPQGLIKATTGKNDKYTGKTFGEGTLFFANADNKYSNTSEALKIVNKSSVDVDVTIGAKVGDADGIKLTEDKTFADDTSASVYLAIKHDTDQETVITSSGASLNAQVAKAPEGAYEIVYDQGQYKYQLTAAASAAEYTGFKDYSFNITGASNANGDWKGLEEAEPTITVTWNVVPHSDYKGPAIAVKTYTMKADESVYVTLDLGKDEAAATGITKITYLNSSGAEKVVDSTSYAVEDGNTTLRFKTSFINSLITAGTQSRDYTITFNDSESTQVTITLKQED